MPRTRQVYLLDPRKLGQETIAVTFAKTSRSPRSFREIADDLTDEKSAGFNERWVVGYGHASVAEHAILHIAIENISRLAVETCNPTAWHRIRKNPPAINNGMTKIIIFRVSTMTHRSKNFTRKQSPAFLKPTNPPFR